MKVPIPLSKLVRMPPYKDEMFQFIGAPLSNPIGDSINLEDRSPKNHGQSAYGRKKPQHPPLSI